MHYARTTIGTNFDKQINLAIGIATLSEMARNYISKHFDQFM